jgi:DNA polymerase-4
MDMIIRKILHLDLDAFFCAVEELRNPALGGKPFAVGGRVSERGVVASCSYAARQFGVRSAMPMARAIKLCPGLIVISSRHAEYGQVSEQVMEKVRVLTPLVEQISIDEAFLDVTELPQPAEQVARQLQATINQQLHLPCSIGVATNKLVAKIANDVGKAAARRGSPPNAITIVPPGQEGEFLRPLPVEALWGVGPKTAARLAEIDVLTIGDLARLPAPQLERMFGKNGQWISQHARGIDDSPLVTFHEAKSISQETTFARDIHEEDALLGALLRLTEQVGRRLRQEDLTGVTVKLKLRWPDFTTLTRQVTLSEPVDQDEQIYQAATRLFHSVWQKHRAVRLIGVGVSGFKPRLRQLSLWQAFPVGETAEPTEKQRRLQAALDDLHNRFGLASIQRGLEKDIDQDPSQPTPRTKGEPE